MINSDQFVLVSKKKCAKKSHSRISLKISSDKKINLQSDTIILNLEKYRLYIIDVQLYIVLLLL